MDPLREALDGVARLGWNPAELHAILYGNAAELFGLPKAREGTPSSRRGVRPRPASATGAR